jgi:hypothetical protein
MEICDGQGRIAMAGQDSDGGGRHRENVFAACRGCVVVLVLYYFDDSFTSTRCLYLSPSQLCLIKRIGTSYARTRAHTCPCAYARARTLTARESRQNILGGVDPTL